MWTGCGWGVPECTPRDTLDHSVLSPANSSHTRNINMVMNHVAIIAVASPNMERV